MSFCQLPVAKSHNFWQILTFGGVSIGLFCRPLAAKNPNFAIFWTSAFSDVDSWPWREREWKKGERGGKRKEGGEGREEMKEGRKPYRSSRLTRQISCECVRCVGYR